MSESHSEETTQSYALLKASAPRYINLNDAPRAYFEKLEIKAKKYDSIMPLARNYIPKAYFSPFYNDLKRQNEETNDSD